MLRIIKPYALKTRWVKPLGEKEIVDEASFKVRHTAYNIISWMK
jgi:hypothetical protein